LVLQTKLLAFLLGAFIPGALAPIHLNQAPFQRVPKQFQRRVTPFLPRPKAIPKGSSAIPDVTNSIPGGSNAISSRSDAISRGSNAMSDGSDTMLSESNAKSGGSNATLQCSRPTLGWFLSALPGENANKTWLFCTCAEASARHGLICQNSCNSNPEPVRIRAHQAGKAGISSSQLNRNCRHTYN
jgi:hypothetical protein